MTADGEIRRMLPEGGALQQRQRTARTGKAGGRPHRAKGAEAVRLGAARELAAGERKAAASGAGNALPSLRFKTALRAGFTHIS
jgi:hypothetical protein